MWTCQLYLDRWANWHIHISSVEGYTNNMTFYILCGINSKHSDI
jgi:hypothetical protein